MVTSSHRIQVRACDLSEEIQRALSLLTEDQTRQFAAPRLPRISGHWDPVALQSAFKRLFDLALAHLGQAPAPSVHLVVTPAEETVAVAIQYPGRIAAPEDLAAIKCPIEAHGGSLTERQQSEFVTYELRLPIDARTPANQA